MAGLDIRPLGATFGGELRALGAALALLLAATATTTAQSAVGAAGDPGPRFRADGPDADAYGRSEGYPSCTALAYLRETRCRVGAFSAFDALFPSRKIWAFGRPSPLRGAAAEPAISYVHGGRTRTLDQYLESQPVTGFLIARGDTILVERYQYGRTDRQRLTSFSMAKTVIGLLIGIAIADGEIASIDDLAETYVPNLTGSEYGRTPIRALLQMASGVWFREVYADPTSDIYTLAELTLGQDPFGSLSAVRRFDTRLEPPGRRFSYSSAESLVLGLVLAGAVGGTVSDYATARLWGPLGAEADASWAIDASGQEITFGYFNATLRDWARLGLMMAHGGAWNGRQVVPRDWLTAATTAAPGAPTSIYGYQVWLPPAPRPMFALRGVRGQAVLVDPEAKVVLVQTALAGDGPEFQELLALWASLPAQLP